MSRTRRLTVGTARMCMPRPLVRSVTAVAEPISSPPPAKRSGWELWSYVPRAFPYLRPHRRAMVGSIVLSVLNPIVHLLQPWPLAIMIDSVAGKHPLPPIAEQILPSGRYQQLAFLVFLGFFLTVLGNALHVWQIAIDARIEQRMVLDFRSDLFQHA